MNALATLFRRCLFAALVLVGASGYAYAQAATASFTYLPASPGAFTQVSFTDTSTGIMPEAWSWDFGDPSSGALNTSHAQNPTHTYGQGGTYTVRLTVVGGFACGCTATSTRTVTVLPGTLAACVVSPTVLCLNGGRFQVSANWTKPDGTTGAATGVTLTDDSGYFWFFSISNIEMVTKVLNGCAPALNNAYWVFAAGLTNVQVNWQVTDTVTGATFTQTNPQGAAFAPIQAINAFPTSCP